MSSSEETGKGATGFDRDLLDAKREAKAAKSLLRRKMLNGNVTIEDKQTAVAAIEDLRDHCAEHKDAGCLETDWDDREPHPEKLQQYVGRTTTIERSLNRRGAPSENVTVPAIAMIDPQTIIAVGDTLDQIAKELGHSSSVREQTPHEEATREDLRGLLKARGQTEALKGLPGSDGADDDQQEADAA